MSSNKLCLILLKKTSISLEGAHEVHEPVLVGLVLLVYARVEEVDKDADLEELYGADSLFGKL